MHLIDVAHALALLDQEVEDSTSALATMYYQSQAAVVMLSAYPEYIRLAVRSMCHGELEVARQVHDKLMRQAERQYQCWRTASEEDAPERELLGEATLAKLRSGELVFSE